MNKVIDFFKNSVDEMTNKVDWPKYSELQGSTILVLVASTVFALVIALIDFMFKGGMELIYQYF